MGCQLRNLRWAPAKNEGVNWLSNKKYSLSKQQFLGLWGVNQYFLGGGYLLMFVKQLKYAYQKTYDKLSIQSFPKVSASIKC